MYLTVCTVCTNYILYYFKTKTQLNIYNEKYFRAIVYKLYTIRFFIKSG